MLGLSDLGWADIRTEMTRLRTLSLPVVASNMLNFLTLFVSLTFIGQYLGTVELDSAGLAISMSNVLGLSVVLGLSTGLDTLGAQAYGSANKQLVGLALQKTLVILTLACFPLWMIWINMEAILLAAAQDPIVARKAQRYCTLITPSLLGNVLMDAFRKYLQVQGLVTPGMKVLVVVNLINVLINYVALGPLDMGLDGSAFALVVSATVQPLLLYLYILWAGDYEATWPGWCKACLLDWTVYMKLAVPGMLMLCLEWWSFETVQVMAGILGSTEVAAMVIVFQYTACCFMVPLGLSVAASIRVGNLLGAGDAALVRKVVRILYVVSWCSGFLIAALTMACRTVVPYIFTTDERVVEMTRGLLVTVALTQIGDNVQAIASGIIRGSGKQLTGAVVNFIGYYVFGLPISSLLAFKTGLGVQGLWVGLLISTTVQAAMFTVILFRADWHEAAREAAARNHVSEKDHLDGSGDEEMLTVLDPTDDSAEAQMLGSDSGSGAGVSRQSFRFNPRISQTVLAQRIGVAVLCVAALSAGIIYREVRHEPTICFPLPPVGNWSERCDDFTSLLAGHSCSISCLDGFEAHGGFECTAAGTALLRNASCLPVS